jgi:hypothetical protein
MNPTEFRNLIAPLAFYVLTLGGLRADAWPAKTPVAPDGMTAALPALQAGYVDFAGLHAGPSDHLADLVARSQGELVLNPTWGVSGTLPILTALLPGPIIYCRLASLQPTTGWADFAGQLQKWSVQGAQGVVLDLRSNGSVNDFDGAAQMASLFLPAGTRLFTVTDAQGKARDYMSTDVLGGSRPALMDEPVVVLINAETVGAGEALAATLKANGAVLIGGSTMGRGALFQDETPTPGQALRFVTGRVTLADGTPLWNHPVDPDIGVEVDAKREAAALDLIAQNKVSEVIAEAAARHRMSEAALVRGEDPEIDAYLTSPEGPGKAVKTAPVTQDSVLVDALDSLKAIGLSERPVGPVPESAAATDVPASVQ